MLIREHVLVRKISCCGGSAIKFRRRKGREEWEEGKKGLEEEAFRAKESEQGGRIHSLGKQEKKMEGKEVEEDEQGGRIHSLNVFSWRAIPARPT